MSTPIKPAVLPGTCNACFVPGNGVAVTLCPLHAAAGEMRDVLSVMAEWRDLLRQDYPDMATLNRAMDRARALLAKVQA